MAIFKACLDAGKVILFLPQKVTIGQGTVALRILLRSLLENGFKDIVVDFSNCDFMDDLGIGELMSAFIGCRKSGGSFSLNRLNTNYKEGGMVFSRRLELINNYNIDYSNYMHINISSDDLSVLNKAVSLASLDTLNLLFTSSNGRIQVLPSQQEGIFRLSLTGNPSSELIIAAPHIIANATRSYIRNEIEEFEAIINSPISTEHDIQKFLENNPKFLLGHEYQKLYSQVVLERAEQGTLIPDFLIQPVNKEFCDIVDLKLPRVPLIVGKDNRKRFSSAIAEAAAQLRTYHDYFDDRERRDAVKKRYGVTAYRPKLAVVVGRAAVVDAVLYKQIQSNLPNIEVVTYDDLIEKAKRFLLL